MTLQWRDIRFEKPTEADASVEWGHIIQLMDNGEVGLYQWDDSFGMVAWMPVSELPEFNRVPDPPEGWRFVEKDEPVDKRARFWSSFNKDWTDRGGSVVGKPYDDEFIYIVPVEPEKPQVPEGYRYRREDEPFDTRAMWWDRVELVWSKTNNNSHGGYSKDLCYVVPIDPPAGWRLVEKGDSWTGKGLYWDHKTNSWMGSANLLAQGYDEKLLYAVPIESPRFAATKPEAFSDLVARHLRELQNAIDSDSINKGQKLAAEFLQNTLRSAIKCFPDKV